MAIGILTNKESRAKKTHGPLMCSLLIKTNPFQQKLKHFLIAR